MASSSFPQVLVVAVSDATWISSESRVSSSWSSSVVSGRVDSGPYEDVESSVVAVRSLTPTGEPDAEVHVRVGRDVVAILVEDKVHAAAQPRQAERYRERGESKQRADVVFV